jgi:hypothetical protein
MRRVLGALFASCFVFGGCNGSAGDSDGGGGGDGGALTLTLTPEGGDAVDCSAGCSIELGELHRYTDPDIRVALSTTDAVTFDPPQVAGCNAVSGLFAVGLDNSVERNDEGIITTRTDSSPVGRCDATVTLFSNASNMPEGGVVVRIGFTVFERFAPGDPCADERTCDGVPAECEFDVDEGARMVARPCPNGSSCNLDVDLGTLCMADPGGTCEVALDGGNSEIVVECSLDDEGCEVEPQGGLGRCVTASSTSCLNNVDAGGIVVNCDAGTCSDVDCVFASGDACLPGASFCGADEDECPEAAVCP